MKPMKLTKLKEIQHSMDDFKESLWKDAHSSELIDVFSWIIDAKDVLSEAIHYAYEYKDANDEYSKLGLLSLYNECLDEVRINLENASTNLNNAFCDEPLRRLIKSHCDYQIHQLSEM